MQISQSGFTLWAFCSCKARQFLQQNTFEHRRQQFWNLIITDSYKNPIRNYFTKTTSPRLPFDTWDWLKLTHKTVNIYFVDYKYDYTLTSWKSSIFWTAATKTRQNLFKKKLQGFGKFYVNLSHRQLLSKGAINNQVKLNWLRACTIKQNRIKKSVFHSQLSGCHVCFYKQPVNCCFC